MDGKVFISFLSYKERGLSPYDYKNFRFESGLSFYSCIKVDFSQNLRTNFEAQVLSLYWSKFY